MSETSMSIRIDDRLRSHIPPLRPDERAQLEENLLRDGCQSPLIVWGDVLLDGHNRYEICQQHGIPFETLAVDLPDFEDAIEWIEENQLGRRNLTADQFAYYIGRKYERTKGARGNPLFRQNVGVAPGETAERVAVEHGVTARTVERAASYARDVDTIADLLGDGVRTEILSGTDSLTRTEVAEIAVVAKEMADTGVLTFANEREALDWAKKLRVAKAEEKRTQNAILKESFNPVLPDGKFETIVIDPPWEMEKIDRDVTPDQVAFDYPTMTEAELIEFGMVADCAADDCHMFCWTTQRFLPSALRLVEAWGFRYILTMTWHKNEASSRLDFHNITANLSSMLGKDLPIFVDTKAFPCCFNWH